MEIVCSVIKKFHERQRIYFNTFLSISISLSFLQLKDFPVGGDAGDTGQDAVDIEDIDVMMDAAVAVFA